MKTTNKEKYSIAMSVKPPHRGGGLEGVSINDVCKPLSLGEAGERPLHSLTKSELATMYFPIGSTSNALRRLNRYINNAHGLLPALLATGYRVNDRHFTRRQVQLIFEYLGEP